MHFGIRKAEGDSAVMTDITGLSLQQDAHAVARVCVSVLGRLAQIILRIIPYLGPNSYSMVPHLEICKLGKLSCETAIKGHYNIAIGTPAV